MYERFYGLTEPPFNLTPNSRFFFESPMHLEALSTLRYAIDHRKGFVVITGEVGSGKTTVCRALLNRLGRETETILVTNTFLGAKDLLCAILDDLGIEYSGGSKARLHALLNQYLIDQIRMDRNVVLIIDEAQNLSPSVMEEVRMLSNLETESEKLIQIIFLGQPELKDKLALRRLEQLRQRIAVYYHLGPLSREEVQAYVAHRLKVAGRPEQDIFTDAALESLHRFSGGIPRILNQLCDSALVGGYVAGRRRIDRDIVEEAMKDSPMNRIVGGAIRKAWTAGGAA